MDKDSQIQALSDALVLKIAAGEVIERPASVVKELAENSLDAGASKIEIQVGDGGRKLISVSDDGCGMSSDNARLSLGRHSTSKISSMEDLESIETFGFRGEALASIAAVSHLALATRLHGEPEGTRILVEGGETRSFEPCGMKPGTRIQASHLFFNVPARKKFLRSRHTEFGHIDKAFIKMALSYPEVAFLLEHDGQIHRNLPAADSLLERLSDLYPDEIYKSLLEVRLEDGPLNVEGYCSNSHHSFSRPEEVHFFINGRSIRDRALNSAVMTGFRSALMERRYPLAVLNLKTPPKQVDVNVHPTKAEVRFSDPQRIFKLVSESIAKTLHGEAKSGYMRDTKFSSSSSRENMTFGGYNQQNSVSFGSRSSSPISEKLGEAILETLARAPEEKYTPAAWPSPSVFGSLEYLGSIDNTFLICRRGTDLMIVDQHAAHERVLFDQLRQDFENRKPKAQKLLIPKTIELDGKREAALREVMPYLDQLGFELDEFGKGTFVIRQVPEILLRVKPERLLLDLLDEYSTVGGRKKITDATDHVLATMACHSAVRAHDPLGREEINHLLEEMDATEFSANCPHGRPTFLKFTVYDFEKLFRRK